jgi:hypothetical protein
MAALEKRGYVLDRQWVWTAPADHAPAEEELDWITFLVQEWDFGGLEGA